MNITRMYGRVLEENDRFVIIEDGNTLYKLQRCRMYNSHLVKDMLYTEYADKEYQVPTSWSLDRRNKANNTGTGNRTRGYEGKRVGC